MSQNRRNNNLTPQKRLPFHNHYHNYPNNTNHLDNNDYSSSDSSDDDNNNNNNNERKKKVRTNNNSNNNKSIIADLDNLQPSSFNDNLFVLLQFRAQYKHCCVPTNHHLFPWVAHLRKQYNKKINKNSGQNNDNNAQEFSNANDSNLLTKERIKVLDSIGFLWQHVRQNQVKKWYDNYSALIEFQIEHGHCNPTPKQSRSLAAWANSQKALKSKYDREKEAEMAKQKQEQQNDDNNDDNNNQNDNDKDEEQKELEYIPLTLEEKFAKLNELGFVWGARDMQIPWEERYEQLVKYQQVHGDCDVPGVYPPNMGLGTFVARQRSQKTKKLVGKKHFLTDEKEELLNKIGFRWVAPGYKKRIVDGYDDMKNDDNVKPGAKTTTATTTTTTNNNNDNNDNDTIG